eukprot:gb/GECH01013830.1/.p1 GENE.gb/GECH01013830.1/~~gb/GECH01013830.1/.p1  ORF type:complete len:1210 (+),score=345.92 gb/GECH01013830.1/:1-3630(+)
MAKPGSKKPKASDKTAENKNSKDENIDAGKAQSKALNRKTRLRKRNRPEINGNKSEQPPTKRRKVNSNTNDSNVKSWAVLLKQGRYSQLTHLKKDKVYFKVKVLNANSRDYAGLKNKTICSITKEEEKVYFESLNSNAIQFINGKRAKVQDKQELISGDEIAMTFNSRTFSFIFFTSEHLDKFAKNANKESNSNEHNKETESMQIDVSSLDDSMDSVPEDKPFDEKDSENETDNETEHENTENSEDDFSKKSDQQQKQNNEAKTKDKESNDSEKTETKTTNESKKEEPNKDKEEKKEKKDNDKEKKSADSESKKAQASSSTSKDSGEEKDFQTIPIFLTDDQKSVSKVIKRRNGSSNTGPSRMPLPISLDIKFLEQLLGDSSADPSSLESGSNNNSDSKNSSSVKDRFVEQLQKHIISAEDIPKSFDNFEYFLNPHIQKQLLNSAFMFLKKPEFAKYVSKMPSLSKKIMLCGDPGTELYQEDLVKAVAKHFGVSLLIFDRSDYMLAQGAARSGFPSSFPEDDDDDDDDDVDEDEVMGGGEGSATITITKIEPQPMPQNEEKQRALVEGDRIVYMGHLPSQGSVSRYLQRPSGSPKAGMRGEVTQVFEGNPNRVGVRFDRPFPSGHTLMGNCEDLHGHYASPSELRLEEHDPDIADEALTDALIETVKKNEPCILFIREATKFLSPGSNRYQKFKREEFNEACLIVASSTTADEDKNSQQGGGGSGPVVLKPQRLQDPSLLDHISLLEPAGKGSPSGKNVRSIRALSKIFTNRVDILPPQEFAKLDKWNEQITNDKKKIKHRTNIQTFQKILKKNDLICKKLNELDLNDKVFEEDDVEQMVGWGVSYHLQQEDDAEFEDNKLKLSVDSLRHAINLYNSLREKSPQDAIKDIETENDFERKMVSEVIPSSEIGVKFEDIGALESVKETLKELVMLPLQRPELFRKGNLTKPCKGILLFGPPGTGKTMLAKAVATESGANFINVTMSSIGSKWFGEAEKYVRALFTLAKKLAPCVVFIDELDSVLGKRDRTNEHEAMRKVKNEFMSSWDGLKSKETEQVIVMGASNRPFDLDDAVLRRMPRRLLVDLPDAENRVKILRVILKHEDLEDNFDFERLAQECDGYSGSDIKNLCVAAAYRPIREILKKEKKKSSDERKADAVDLRPLCLDDFLKAKDEISASVHEDAASISELRKWNDMYGEGGSRQKQSLSYFL